MTVVRQITLFIIIVVLSIYMLLDGRRIGRFVSRNFPTHGEADGAEYVGRAKTAVVDYVKAQVLLSAVMGASVVVAMWILVLVGAWCAAVTRESGAGGGVPDGAVSPRPADPEADTTGAVPTA